MDIKSTTFFSRLCESMETLFLFQIMDSSHKVPMVEGFDYIVSWTSSSKTIELLVVWDAITLIWHCRNVQHCFHIYHIHTVMWQSSLGYLELCHNMKSPSCEICRSKKGTRKQLFSLSILVLYPVSPPFSLWSTSQQMGATIWNISVPPLHSIWWKYYKTVNK